MKPVASESAVQQDFFAKTHASTSSSQQLISLNWILEER
jgi:hypothetical protein